MPRVPKTLVARFKKAAEQAELFPSFTTNNYYHAYSTFESWLVRNVHPHVNQRAMMIDGGYLTDHGPEHIKRVIQRASDLLGAGDKIALTPYEIFLLLSAIQVHDAGHIEAGRINHEQNAQPLLTHLPVDRAEQSYILQIARAHGGKLADGDKDTIERGLPIKDDFDGIEFHPRFLAALLRFADELADDRSRGARYLFDQGRIPVSSEVYHAYALALYSVAVNSVDHEVKLSFEVEANQVDKLYGKGIGVDAQGSPIIEEVYLLDEIFKRTFKMYQECVYCMRFFPSHLQIKKITVKISVVDDGDRSPVHETIGYQLTERGYPRFADNSVADMCGVDITFEGRVIDGATLKERLDGLKNSTTPAV
ncbi:hypothetical protein SAMN02745146_3062 [Hymenobacter daecheongensis DSM 21074]|uniref:HD-CE domain-containing protein n=1 Tax=Hymenobacter daecheongensis DSM 21074 TaxID=1121955 RepID=A0A1M6J1W7_9BACT|nr:hypothetical protein [Hymenobacter daecheongensis]SHJ40733.1 hypothetical protein SAMN02745146_3062 [Hymenobacter daecheongensis DSM 21074]